MIIKLNKDGRIDKKRRQTKLKCKYCGSDFLSNKSNAMYCSNTCRVYSSRENKGIKEKTSVLSDEIVKKVRTINPAYQKQSDKLKELNKHIKMLSQVRKLKRDIEKYNVAQKELKRLKPMQATAALSLKRIKKYL